MRPPSEGEQAAKILMLEQSIEKATEKNWIVIVIKNGWTDLDGDPYLATMEDAIKECLDFNIGNLSDDETKYFANELSKIDSLLKKKDYQEAWDYWLLEVGPGPYVKYVMRCYKIL